MWTLNAKLVRDLLRWRGQLIAVAAIVACGIASYVAFASLYLSFDRSLTSYYETYGFADVFDQLTRAPQLLERQIRSIPGVAAVQTRVTKDVSIDIPGQVDPAIGDIVSVPDEPPAINGLHLRVGRYVRPSAHGEVIISESFASGNHLTVGASLGAVINGRWQNLRVVGIAISPEFIYEVHPGDLYPDPRHYGVLWMGEKDVATAFDMYGAFNDVALKLTRFASRPAVIAELDRILAPYGGVGAYDRRYQPSARLLSDAEVRLRVASVLMSTIFLAVAAFLLNAMMFRLVATQRDQIAVLKAFGFENVTIALHYLGFVAAVILIGALVGAVLGLAWGYSFTNLYKEFLHLPVLQFQTSISVFLGSVVLCAFASAIGALFAVRHAVSVAPAQAMRPEAPAGYRPTILERLRLERAFSLPTRIVLRNVERKPFVAVLSVLGIALAIALLMLGRWMPDAINAMEDIEFRHAWHADATVVYNHALAPGATSDLMSFPGVRRVEPYRSVAARVSYGNIWRDVPLTGLLQNGELRRILTSNLHEIPVPIQGVVLTKRLAQALRIGVGQMLRVNVLEERRPALLMKVVGITDEYVGTYVYCDLGTLDALLGEKGQSSGAFVAIDPAQTDLLYARLKRTPAVAGVSLREATLNNFYQTVYNALRPEIGLILLFACVIAFGVAYNTARISLSERSIELSSLRILGFTRQETWRILAGEQVFFIVAAALPGIVMGALITLWLSLVRSTEDYTLPWIVTPGAVAFALVFSLLMVIVSALIVRRQVNRLDLVAVLKSGD